jgi:hypothetical protein
MEIALDGSDIQTADTAEWVPWGTRGNAKAKILGSADGYAAATDSTHADCATDTGATYVVIFKV